ncbi:MAG: NAD(P)-dependent oxidoreductase [Elusimicrobiales bacterium]|nr:NAD(P)-dependent oxidoreductase [Elusimicrobiales bacterium]
MKKILVTGGTGFIGRNVVEAFADIYDVSAPSHAELELADARAVRGYFRGKSFDAIIHCAIKPGHRNAKDAAGLLYSNTRQFFNLADCADSWEKMVFLTSGLVYNQNKYSPKMREDYFGEYPPEDEVGFAKYLCAGYAEKCGGEITELRPFGVYGKYEDYAIRFISNALCKTLFDMPVTIKQNRRFDYVHVSDLVAAIRHFVETPARHAAYNVTPDKSAELAQIAALALEISGKELPVIIKTPGMGAEYSGDNSRLKAEFPDFPRTGLKEGMLSLYQWYAARKNSLDKSLLLEDK